jgi:hypothetical protein
MCLRWVITAQAGLAPAPRAAAALVVAQDAELEPQLQEHLRLRPLRPQRRKAVLPRLPPLPSAEQAAAVVDALAAERPSRMPRKSAR